MFCLKPIGIIHTPYQSLEQMPIQPKGGGNNQGRIIIEQQYQEGLKDLEGFSHLYLIYAFHQSRGYQLKVLPFMDDKEHGVFATRAPKRPNPIGLSIVELLAVENNEIHIAGVDIVDGTPLLDIKPYIEAFDKVEQARNGWMKSSEQAVTATRSDQRFV